MRPDILDIEAEAEKVQDGGPQKLTKQNSQRGNFYQKLAARGDSFKSVKGLPADTANEDVPPSLSTSEELAGAPARKGVQFGSESEDEDPAGADQSASSAGQLIMITEPSVNVKKDGSPEPLIQGVDPVAAALDNENEHRERRQSSALDLATDESQTQEPRSLLDALKKRHTYSNSVLEDVMPGMENYDTSWVNDGLSDSSSDDEDIDASFDLSMFAAAAGQAPSASTSSRGATHKAHSRVMVTERRSSVQGPMPGSLQGSSQSSNASSGGRDIHRLNAEETARFGGMERTRKATARSNDGRAVVNPRTASGRRLYGPQRYSSATPNDPEPEDAKTFIAKYSPKKSKCKAPAETRGIQVRPSPPSILKPTSARSSLPQSVPSMNASKSMGAQNVKFSEMGRRRTLGAMPKTLSRFAASGSHKSDNGSRRPDGGARKSDGGSRRSDGGDGLTPINLENLGFFGGETSTSPRFLTPSPPQSPQPRGMSPSPQSSGSTSSGSMQALPSLVEGAET